MSDWLLNIDAWPGPNRKKWPDLQDIVQESPDGRHIAVVYSCDEIGMGKEVGLFALLAGPPDAPTMLLRPRKLTCLVWYSGTTVQWVGARYCVISPYCVRQRWSDKPRAFGGTMYIDVEQRKAAYQPDVYPGAATSALPTGLAWRSWTWLSFWPLLWSLCKIRSP